MKSKRKFRENHQNIVKDNMGQAVLSFDQKICFDKKRKFLFRFLVQILLKQKRAESDQIKLAYF